MFRSSTILRDVVQSLAKVTFLLKHSVKLRRCILYSITEMLPHLDIIQFKHKYNFSQALFKLPEDGRRPKHVGAIFMRWIVY